MKTVKLSNKQLRHLVENESLHLGEALAPYVDDHIKAVQGSLAAMIRRSADALAMHMVLGSKSRRGEGDWKHGALQELEDMFERAKREAGPLP